jgi:hypothetical protein
MNVLSNVMYHVNTSDLFFFFLISREKITILGHELRIVVDLARYKANFYDPIHQLTLSMLQFKQPKTEPPN